MTVDDFARIARHAGVVADANRRTEVEIRLVADGLQVTCRVTRHSNQRAARRTLAWADITFEGAIETIASAKAAALAAFGAAAAEV